MKITYGTKGSDKVVGGKGDEYIFGYPKSFSLPQGGDPDAEKGDDTLSGGGGSDTLLGGGGSDVLKGDAGYDLLYGDAGDDRLDLGSDTDGGGLAGGDGDDTLIGSQGADQISDLTFDSEFSAEKGNDEIKAAGGDDIVTTFGGADTIDAGGGGDDQVIFRRDGSGADLSFTYVAGGVSALIEGKLRSEVRNAESISFTGGEGDDSLNFAGLSGQSIANGGAGRDTLVGGDNLDIIDGGAGDDRIDLGRDQEGGTANGGDGRDMLIGSAGLNYLYGDAGDDTLLGGAGDDSLAGGDGTDTASYARSAKAVYLYMDGGVVGGGAQGDELSGIENVVGSGGDDSLVGDDGSNMLEGGGGHDQLGGGDGADTLIGGDGDDTIGGSDGADTLQGGSGKDRLDGGEDDDLLSGGSKADRFVFTGAVGADRIADFQDSVDRIDLIGMRAINGEDAIDFSQLLVTQRGEAARIELDLDRDGKADKIDLNFDGSADRFSVDLSKFDAELLGKADFFF